MTFIKDIELIETNIVSVYMDVLIRLYLSCMSFDLNLLDRVGQATDLIARWVVDLIVYLAASRPIPQFLTKSVAVMPNCLSDEET